MDQIHRLIEEQEYYEEPIAMCGKQDQKIYKFPRRLGSKPNEIIALRSIKVYTGEYPGKIKCLRCPKFIKGIGVCMTDAQKRTFGTRTATKQELVLGNGEWITQLSLRANRQGTHIASIYITTNKKATLKARATGDLADDQVDVSVGSGICLGVLGSAGMDINSIGFVFLRKIINSRLSDVRYKLYPDEERSVAKFSNRIVSGISRKVPSAPVYSNEKFEEKHYWYVPEFSEKYDLQPIVIAKPFVVVDAHQQKPNKLTVGRYHATQDQSEEEYILTEGDADKEYSSFDNIQEIRINQIQNINLEVPTELEAFTVQGEVEGLPFDANLQLNLESEKGLDFRINGYYHSSVFLPRIVLGQSLVFEQRRQQQHKGQKVHGRRRLRLRQQQKKWVRELPTVQEDCQYENQVHDQEQEIQTAQDS